jgi:hypothetical protein
MRTTLVIDDELLRQAKRRAAEWNLTVSDIVNDSLRESLGRPARAAPSFSLITYGRSSKSLPKRTLGKWRDSAALPQ